MKVSLNSALLLLVFFFFQAEDGIRDYKVTGVQTCALPICAGVKGLYLNCGVVDLRQGRNGQLPEGDPAHEEDANHQEGGGDRPQNERPRSEEHTSELQSPCNIVCRLLLEKKKIMSYT